MKFKKEQLITAIDISDGLVKAAAISVDKGQKFLRALDSAALPEDDREIAKQIRALITRNKLGRSDFYVSFPRHLVTLRNVRLPTTNEEEVRNMAELQAVKYLPYAREEIVVAHKTIEVTNDGYTDILLILAQKKAIERYLDIFKEAGISVEKIALSSEGILSWYFSMRVEDSRPVAIIDVDKQHTHIQIVKDKKLLFTRSISFNTTDSPSRERGLLKEANLSFDAFLKEQGEKVSRVILTGSQVFVKSVSKFLIEGLTAPCEMAEQLRRIKIKGPATKMIHKFGEASFTHLLGIALDPDALDINLLPGEVIHRKREQTMKAELIKTSILLLAVLLACLGIAYNNIRDKKSYLREINSRLSEIEPEVKRLSKLKGNIELVQDQLTLEGSAIDIMRELYATLPEDVSLTLFEFEDGDRILLRGAAKELSRVFDLLPVLEKSAYFEDVKINFANKRTFKGKEFADFEIICPLK